MQRNGFFSLLWKDKKGAAAAEYVLILAIIGSVLVIAMTNLGTAISNGIDGTTAVINANVPGSSGGTGGTVP